MTAASTLILSRAQIRRLASARDYRRAVEAAFLALARGEITTLPVGHVPGVEGGFHLKAAVATAAPRWAVIKINGNFPRNPQQFGLPTIQGCLVLSDALDGRLLAVMDSIEITAQRTAAASALAAQHLARRGSRRLALIGCGTQADYHFDAFQALDEFALRELRCFDPDRGRAGRLRDRAIAAGWESQVCESVAEACREADLIVTCTPSAQPLLELDMVRRGSFVAAIGADNPSKCEIAPTLLRQARVVPDLVAQAATLGDLRAAIEAGVMTAGDIHAELADVVSGTRPGRRNDDEIIVFDSTGSAIQDLAAASLIFQRASSDPGAMRVALNADGAQD